MTDQAILKQIENDIKSNDILVYMKGTKDMPRCGFSGMVVQIFTHLNVPFKDINVLDSKEVWDGVKEYNNWPTIPQVFVKGEFIGGADICKELFQSGELQNILKEKGLIKAA